MLLAAIAATDPVLQAPDLQTTAQPGVPQATPVADGQPSPLPGPQAAAESKTNTVQGPSLDPAAITAPKGGAKPDRTANADKTEADVAAVTVQDPSLDPGVIIALKSGTKPDKTANADKIETDATVVTEQDPSLDPGAITKSGTKPDKKANVDKTGADIAAVSPPVQSQIPILPQLPIAPMAQVAVQTQTVASTDDDSDSVLGITGSSTTGTSNAVPVTPASNAAQPVAPEPPQAGAKQAAAPAQPLTAANDDSVDDSDAPSNIASTDQAKPAAHVAEIKFTQIRNPGNKSVNPAAPQPQATADEDADMAAEPSSAQASTGLETTTQTQASLTDTAQPSLAPPAPQKPDATDKPTPGKIADLPPPGTNNVAAAQDPAQNPNATPSMPADSNSDSKPAHVTASTAPQAQPDAPQPPAHTAAAALPQTVLAINPAGTNTADGLTLSVHVASHDTGSQSSTPSDVTPNIDALAVSVAARSVGGAKQFDIRLDPPELGRVEVRLSIDASGKTQAHMTADQPQTLELLQKDATNLTRALRDAGLDVSQNGLNFSLKGQGQNSGGQSGNFGNAARNLSLPAITQNIETAQPINIPYSLLGNARLDIHV